MIMNYHAMSDTEFMHYLDLHSDDPVVRRLIGVLERTQSALIDDLVDAGMDAQDWTFGDGWGRSSPGQYIQELRRERDQAESDLRIAQYELEDVIRERDQLQTRNIMQFIEEVHEEKRTNRAKADAAYREANRMREENDKLREQIDMWGAMNRV